jgi:hypothetical protein
MSRQALIRIGRNDLEAWVAAQAFLDLGADLKCVVSGGDGRWHVWAIYDFPGDTQAEFDELNQRLQSMIDSRMGPIREAEAARSR